MPIIAKLKAGVQLQHTPEIVTGNPGNQLKTFISNKFLACNFLILPLQCDEQIRFPPVILLSCMFQKFLTNLSKRQIQVNARSWYYLIKSTSLRPL